MNRLEFDWLGGTAKLDYEQLTWKHPSESVVGLLTTMTKAYLDQYSPGYGDMAAWVFQSLVDDLGPANVVFEIADSDSDEEVIY